MMRAFFPILPTLAATMLLGLGLAAAPSALAELTFETTEVSHVAKPEDESFTYEYKFQNTGKEKVVIKKMEAGCSCTKAEAASKSIEPGEKGSIKVTFTFEDRQGSIPRTVAVETNEGLYHLLMDVEIPVLLSMNVPLITWANGEAPEPREIELSMIPNSPIKNLKVEFENPKGFQWDLKETTDKEKTKGRTFTLTVTPDSTEKQIQSRIFFKTDFPKDKPRVYTVFTMVKPKVKR